MGGVSRRRRAVERKKGKKANPGHLFPQRASRPPHAMQLSGGNRAGNQDSNAATLTTTPYDESLRGFFESVLEALSRFARAPDEVN